MLSTCEYSVLEMVTWADTWQLLPILQTSQNQDTKCKNEKNETNEKQRTLQWCKVSAKYVSKPCEYSQ